MRHFVISDPHSYFSLMHKALSDAGFFDYKGEKRLVLCGDALDRGEEAQKMVDFLLSLLEKGELIYVAGNHEDLLVRLLHEVARGDVFSIATGDSVHVRNGTWGTALQLAKMHKESAYRYPEMLVRRVMDTDYYQILLPKTQDYYETEHYIFTHGYIPCHMEGFPPMVKYSYDENWRNASVEQWKRARWFNGMELNCVYGVREEGKTIVCGHFHASYGHSKISGVCSEWGRDAIFLPFYNEGIIAIDASVANSGTINCIVIDDDPV